MEDGEREDVSVAATSLAVTYSQLRQRQPIALSDCFNQAVVKIKETVFVGCALGVVQDAGCIRSG
jgi:hypothetical protein